MNINDPAITSKSEPGWQILGELELSVGASVKDALYAWLTEILGPLNLPINFLERVLNSAQDSASRALQSSADVTFGHIHLSIFVPNDLVSNGKTWGFFQIGRVENQADGVAARDHSIDFYLYLE